MIVKIALATLIALLSFSSMASSEISRLKVACFYEIKAQSYPLSSTGISNSKMVSNNVRKILNISTTFSAIKNIGSKCSGSIACFMPYENKVYITPMIHNVSSYCRCFVIAHESYHGYQFKYDKSSYSNPAVIEHQADSFAHDYCKDL